MTYREAYIKLSFRCNKSATEDIGNIDNDEADEVINKALDEWLRRQVHGGNLYKEGSEESRMRVDDLQPLLVPMYKMSLKNGGIFSETSSLPKNYRYFNRFTVKHTPEGCSNSINLISDLKEEANVDVLLNVDGTKPSLKYEQFFHTLIGNKIRFYHNKEINPTEGYLTYYRAHKKYSARKTEEEFELKDDVMELIIDEAAKIKSGDFDNVLQHQRNSASVENNN